MDIPPGFIPTFHEDSAFQPTISLVQTLLNMRVVQTTIAVKKGGARHRYGCSDSGRGVTCRCLSGRCTGAVDCCCCC